MSVFEHASVPYRENLSQGRLLIGFYCFINHL